MRRRWRSSTRRRNCCRQFAPSRRRGSTFDLDFDQSVFVRAAISSVVREAFIVGAARLAHDPRVSRQLAQRVDRRARRSRWRSPARSSACRLTGNSFNIMTLGGLVAVDRPARRRRHDHRRKHPSQSQRWGNRSRSHSRWRGADLAAGDHGHAGHLHRLLPRRAARRAGAIPLRADGAGGRGGHARGVRALAHARQDTVAHAARGRTRPRPRA